MNQYIIVETIFEAEFRIAMLSYRYVSDIPIWMCLADAYYTREIGENSPSTRRFNRFASFKEAEKAVQELLKPIDDEEEINEMCQEDRVESEYHREADIEDRK